ncbi:hypothetical protein [Nostoc sp. MS1]|nr:hypothetical protein [Nostoc sp. MS1]
MLFINFSCVTAYQPNGEVIAVVEAKWQSRDPRIAQGQVEY